MFEAVRGHRYRQAAKLFDAWKPERKQLSPELRFLRARLAAELEQHALVVQLLDALEQRLPELAEEIGQLRVQAQAQVGPYGPVIKQLQASSSFGDTLLAVDAWRAQKKPEKAVELLDRRLPQVEKRKQQSQSAQLRRQRAELLLELGNEKRAIEDLKWLALEVPTQAAANAADELYEKHSGRKLSKAERYARAEAFTQAGARDAALRELKLLAEAPGKGPPGVEILRTRAWAEYKARGDYLQAAKLFEQTAKLDRTYRTQDLFFAARSLSRAHRDEEAIQRYLKLAKQSPKSGFAEQARYLAARLHYILGQWQAAEQAYDDYLKRYSRGKKRGRYDSAVRYERSVTQLAAGRGAHAVETLEDLVKRESSAREAANLRQLLGVALLQAKKPEQAEKLFRRVIEDRPLSFAALASAMRLQAQGTELPPLMPPADAEETKAPLEVQLPTKVKLLHRLGLDDDAERELHRQAASFKRQHAPNGGQALCQAYAQLSTAKRRYRHALNTVKEGALLKAITADTRWAWDCIYPRPYAEWVAKQEAARDIPAGLVHGLMRQESAFQPVVVSHAGAIGLMQLIPPTAKSVAKELEMELNLEDLRSPQVNIELGTFYLSKLLRRFGGHVPSAVASYNAGPGAVDRWRESGKDLPLDVFVARIPYQETRGYVRRVIGNWARYRYLSQGLDAVPKLELKLPDSVKPDESDY